MVRCPFHSDGRERTPSLSISPGEGVWYCHACGIGGYLNTLLKKVTGKEFNLPTVDIPKEDETGVDPSFLSLFDPLPDHILPGYDRYELKKAGLRYDPYRERIIYPVRDKYWRLVGIVGRLTQEEIEAKNNRVGKYKKYAKAEWGVDYIFHKSDHLWPFHLEYRQRLLRPRPIILVEGFKAALWLRSAGLPAYAVMTASMSKSQKNLALCSATRVYLWFDWNSAGIGGMIKAAEELYWATRVFIVAPPRNFDFTKKANDQPDDFSLDVVSDMIANAERYNSERSRTRKRRTKWTRS